MNKLSTDLTRSIQEIRRVVADLLDELIVMDTQAMRAHSQEMRIGGLVRMSESSTQTDQQLQGVP